MLYLSLFRNQWRQTLRSFRFRSRWLTLLVLGLLGTYVVFVLVSAGYVFREMLAEVFPEADPVAFINEHLLSVFLFLFTLRFFLQRTPQVSLQPYLHLPISRARLVRFFSFASLGSAHNFVPLLFFVPFWIRHLMDGGYGLLGAWLWLGGIVALLVLSNYLNILTRALLTGGVQQVVGLALFVAALFVADLVLGTGIAARLSAPLFESLLAGNPLALVALGVLLLGVAAAVGRLLRDRLYDTASAQQAAGGWTPAFVPERGPVYNLLLLELKLMWRHRRPRTYAFMAGFFGTVYVAVFLAGNAAESVLMAAFLGLFATGIFALNYGQLMFSWESAYFDGHLARALDLRDLVRAKLILLEVSCVVFYFISLPIFLWLAPGMLKLHAAFMVYNAGVTCVIMLALGVTNQKPIDLARGGAFLNYEGFSIVHWLWFIPTALPPLGLLFLTRERPDLGLAMLAALGLVGLALTRPLSGLFGRVLARRRYRMAAGFRDNA